MWPFKRKQRIDPTTMEFVRICMKQVGECVSLVNSTVSPQVFFGRLNMLLDLLLELRKYEKYGIFQNSTPTDDYNKVIGNLEKTVDDFIDRAIAANGQKIAKYKTEAAKERNKVKFILDLADGFDMADTFWSGNPMMPHYEGRLYTERNRDRIDDLVANMYL